jgi:hypothetical protein
LGGLFARITAESSAPRFSVETAASEPAAMGSFASKASPFCTSNPAISFIWRTLAGRPAAGAGAAAMRASSIPGFFAEKA